MSERERNDQRMRDAFSSIDQPADSADSTVNCPGDEEIWAASRGELSPERAKLLLAHSLECTDCRQSWLAASTLAAEGGLDEAGRSARAEAQSSRPSSRFQDAARGRVIPFRTRHHRLIRVISAVAATLVIMFALTTLLNREEVQFLPPILAEQTRTELWRVGESQPLKAGDPLRTGDRIYLTVESDVPVHLYLINQDQAGASAALFPVQGAQWNNPLPPGEIHRLPGNTTWQYDSWEVSSAGGRESFMVIAALEPLQELESALSLLDAAVPQDQVLRGESMVPTTTGTDPGLAAAALAGALESLRREGSDRSVMVREIVLENPRSPDS